MKLKSLQEKPVQKANGGGWQDKLKVILHEHNHLKLSGRGNASYRSQEARATRIWNFFEVLRRDLHFGIADPKNLKPKHIEALVKYWVDKQLSANTIDNHLTVLRLFSSWINKTGMVHSLSHYCPDMKRTYAAQTDKSWSATGKDPWELWDKVYEKDKVVGMQLLLGMAFGARRKEMVSFKPFIHCHEQYIELFQGTKGGRPRIVAISNEFQRAVTQVLKDFVRSRGGKPEEYLGSPDKTLLQNLNRFDYVLKSVGITKKDEGVTGHGLRAEYANNELQKRGLITTIRGGTGKLGDKFSTRLAYLQVSEDLGHSRVSVMPAYAGSFVLSVDRKQESGKKDLTDK